MDFENQQTNEQLDEQLRNIAIPPDLKSQLKQIPIQQVVSRPRTAITFASRPWRIQATYWCSGVLAAGLISFGLFFASQYLRNTKPGESSSSGIAARDLENNKTLDPVNGSELHRNELTEFLTEQEQLEIVIHQIEIARMQSRLAQLNRITSSQLDQREVESMIAAMSEKYSLELGISKIQVSSRMAQVIDRFPGTRGAKIAHEYLNQVNN